MSLRDALSALRRGWWLVLILVLMGIAASAVFSVLQHPRYTANSAVFVSVQQASSVQDLTLGSNFTQQIVASYAEVAVEPIVLDRVAREIGETGSSADLARSVTAEAPLNTSVIQITATDGSPARAARIANLVSESLQSVVDEISPGQAGDSSPIKITQIRASTPPTSPSSPNVVVDVLLGLVGGLFVGLVLALLRPALDTRVRIPEQLRELGAEPFIGITPFDAAIRRQPLLPSVESTHRLGESFRTIRANFQFLSIDRPNRIVTVTSSMASEGKSTLVANLGLAFAAAGRRVLLIDADLRRPKLASYFGVDESVGLSDVLVATATREEAIQRWGDNALSLLPAGSAPPNPSELLQSDTMRRLLIELAESYDIILVDAPPILPVADAAILSSISDGVLLCVSARRARRVQVSSALRQIHQSGAHLLGAVLTMAVTSDIAAYGYGGYYDQPAQSRSNDSANFAGRRPEIPVAGAGTSSKTPAVTAQVGAEDDI